MIRHESIRFKLLRGGVEYGELFAGDNVPVLMMNSSGEIKMSLQGEFFAQAVDLHGKPVEVDWMADEIEPVLKIDETEKPLGILMPAKISNSKTKTGETVMIQAYDRCWTIRDNKLDTSLYYPAETPYLDAVESLLTACGVTGIIKTPSDEVMAENREDWQTGESYLTVINQLLSEINYKQLWFNQDGVAILEPKDVPKAENIKHVFTDKPINPRIPKEVEAIKIYPAVSREIDIYSTPNVFVCICSNADKSTGMKATAENRNPQSPLSISRRGRKIVKVVNVKNIANQTALQVYANNLLNETMMVGETIQIDTQLMNGFGVGEAVAIRSDDEIGGICLEQSWSMQLTPGGTMTHTLEKVVLNIDV